MPYTRFPHTVGVLFGDGDVAALAFDLHPTDSDPGRYVLNGPIVLATFTRRAERLTNMNILLQQLREGDPRAAVDLEPIKRGTIKIMTNSGGETYLTIPNSKSAEDEIGERTEFLFCQVLPISQDSGSLKLLKQFVLDVAA